MPFLTIVILALVQGITEFLPISSSGHLVLVHEFFPGDKTALQAAQANLMMDVAVHVGTLFSVLLYFRRDVAAMGRGFCALLCRAHASDKAALSATQDSRLLLHVLIASVPVIIAGFLVHQFMIDIIRGLEVMAWMTLIFGAILWAVDDLKPTDRSVGDMTISHALGIGLAQALALVPGTSRSGITMTAARYLGYSRAESAHFSLLLAIIAIAGAGTLAGIDLLRSGDFALTLDALLAASLAFISGWVAIALMMKWLERATFRPFAIYRIILGAILLIGLYGGFIG